jgi:hypothetical protein
MVPPTGRQEKAAMFQGVQIETQSAPQIGGCPMKDSDAKRLLRQKIKDGLSPLILTVSGIVRVGAVSYPFLDAVENDTQQILSLKILARHLSEVERR